MANIHVIGIGYRPLDGEAREAVLRAGVVLASRRLFDVFTGYEEYPAVKDKVKVIASVDETMEFMRSFLAEGAGDVALLASGDPLFFGIWRRTVREFGPEAVRILPDLCSAQVAFARMGEPWEDAFFMSVHGSPEGKSRGSRHLGLGDIPPLLMRHRKVAVLTDRVNNPGEVARAILGSGIRTEAIRMYVSEKLGYPDECLTGGSLKDMAEREFSDPNVVILRCEDEKGHEPVFGLREADLAHRAGLITKDEVRAVSLHRLRLPETGVLWDIGAGSGSVSIEAARMCPGLKVFSVEKDPGQAKHLRENRARFSAPNVKVVEGAAPEALEGLPDPHRVFIGGSGGRLQDVIAHVDRRMPAGLVVVNSATVGTLNEALEVLGQRGFQVSASQVSVARTKAVAGRMHLAALNPVFVVWGQRS